MRTKEITERIRELIAEEFQVPIERVTLQTSVVDDFGADSLATISLMLALQDAFHVRIDDTQSANLSTVQDIITLIAGLSEGTSNAS